jgi:hypothetical protein
VISYWVHSIREKVVKMNSRKLTQTIFTEYCENAHEVKPNIYI